MLRTQSIPIYQDDPDDWHRFLYKASKGSIKAPEILDYANMAYMVVLTGDLTSPETMNLDDYNALLRARFVAQPPVSSLQQFHDVATDASWVPHAFRVSESPRYPAARGIGTILNSSVSTASFRVVT